MTPWPCSPAVGNPPRLVALRWPSLPAAGQVASPAWPPAAVVTDGAGGGLATPLPTPAPAKVCFDEAEVARLTAAAAAAADLEARRAVRQELAAVEVAALERLAGELCAARAARVEADRAGRRQLALVAGGIARALAADGGDPHRSLAAVSAMLDGLPAVAGARLIVGPTTAAGIEHRLAELARRAGFPIALEVDKGGEHNGGAMRLAWEGGWAEHDPDAVALEIAGLIAAHAVPHPEGETEDAQQTSLDSAPAALWVMS